MLLTHSAFGQEQFLGGIAHSDVVYFIAITVPHHIPLFCYVPTGPSQTSISQGNQET